VAGEALRLIRVTYGAEGGGGRVAAWCVTSSETWRDRSVRAGAHWMLGSSVTRHAYAGQFLCNEALLQNSNTRKIASLSACLYNVASNHTTVRTKKFNNKIIL
jgi:hypothetical protein